MLDARWMHVGESVTEVKDESAKQQRFIYAAFIVIKIIHSLLLTYFKQMNKLFYERGSWKTMS